MLPDVIALYYHVGSRGSLGFEVEGASRASASYYAM